MDFRWKDFTPGKDIQDVTVRYKCQPADDKDTPGLELRLAGARDVWSKRDVEDLHKDLLKLITPLPEALAERAKSAGRDPGFKVDFVTEEFPEYTGDLGEKFLKSALAELRGEVSDNGTPAFNLKFRGKRWATFTPGESRFPKVGKASFAIHYFVYKGDHFAGMRVQVREAQALGREEGGVHVYYDAFRVPPYGDPGDDWLKLDEDRARRLTEVPDELAPLAKHSFRPMLLLPGNNQLFGRVYLSRFLNPGIRQTLNRERLQTNEAFEQLRRFVRLGLNWLTVMYARHTEEDRASGRRARDEDESNPVALLAKAEDAVSGDRDMRSEQREEVAQAIGLAKTLIEEEREEHIGELQMLRVLASTGTSIVVVEHQLSHVLAGLTETVGRLRATLKRRSDSGFVGAAALVDGLAGWIDDARYQGEMLGLLMGQKARLRRRPFALRPLVEKSRLAYGRYMADLGISFHNKVESGFRMPPMYECELIAVLLNFITNALKAVVRQPSREICVEATREGGCACIRFMDTGIGADSDKWDEYFKPFVSESEPDPMLGVGTGLGLKIVKDFAQVYGGEVSFVPPTRPWKTCIVFRVPEE